ncbi:hypothetical protein LSG23_20605 (plasmid) [Bacillus velezensis]|uniref:hypothetical protein n=1 Tax=Bacillus velezensis TaxID=492670 RepID=UPI0009880614|nr:hypothetical protein [Bacillus velezensis]AQS42480.1 hypothetical protein BVH55_00355 [Bacillus velezensis]WNR83189.1 hypothetical protein RP314_20725 [Bacillus velezensis]
MISIGFILYVVAWILSILNAFVWGMKDADKDSDTKVFRISFCLYGMYTSLFVVFYSVLNAFLKRGYKFVLEDDNPLMNPFILAVINMIALGLLTFCIHRLTRKIFRMKVKKA